VKELGMVLLGVGAIGLFFAFMIYPNLEYTGGRSVSSCYGECYEEYVKLYGTPAEIEQRKRALAEGDEFSSIRSLWGGCAACHGNNGQGMGVFPKLAGQTSDYIVQRLQAYRNREEIGNMSSTMWAQSGQLTDAEIQTIGDFIQAGLPGD
tara:strand:+ start:198 stop:647 length:450 start_codon:yes stop_codon:yes gene_type:complete